MHRNHHLFSFFFLLIFLHVPQLVVAREDSTHDMPLSLATRVSPADSSTYSSDAQVILQWYDIFVNIPHDWVHWSEGTFATRNIQLFLGLAILTVALVSTDDATWTASNKWYKGSRTIEKASDIGHIATTMATLTVLSENYPDLVWMEPVGYSLTGLVGIGLVNNGWYWYSDLPLEMALGHTFGHIVSHPFDTDKARDPREVKLSLAPIAMARGDGLSISLQF